MCLASACGCSGSHPRCRRGRHLAARKGNSKPGTDCEARTTIRRAGCPSLRQAGYVFSWGRSCASERSAAFTPLQRGTFALTLWISPSPREVRTVKRPEGRAPAVTDWGANNQYSWWKGSGMFQTTSTERRAAGGDRPRSGGNVKMLPPEMYTDVCNCQFPLTAYAPNPL